jgi:hypothetical protein
LQSVPTFQSASTSQSESTSQGASTSQSASISQSASTAQGASTAHQSASTAHAPLPPLPPPRSGHSPAQSAQPDGVAATTLVIDDTSNGLSSNGLSNISEAAAAGARTGGVGAPDIKEESGLLQKMATAMATANRHHGLLGGKASAAEEPSSTADRHHGFLIPVR